MVDEIVSLNALVEFYTNLTKNGPFSLSTLQKIEELHVQNSNDIDIY